MQEEIQEGSLVYEDELGKWCVSFKCCYCEKEIHKPIQYIRDENRKYLGYRDQELILLHECGSGLILRTKVLVKKEER